MLLTTQYEWQNYLLLLLLPLMLLISGSVEAANAGDCVKLYADLRIARQAVLDEQDDLAIKTLSHAQWQTKSILTEKQGGNELRPIIHLLDADIASALASERLNNPDRGSSLEAIQSALDVCIPEQALSRGLVKAYRNIVNAYVMVSSPKFRPEQHQLATDYLIKARNILSQESSDTVLRRWVQNQVDRHPPDAASLKILMGVFQLRIQQQSQSG